MSLTIYFSYNMFYEKRSIYIHVRYIVSIHAYVYMYTCIYRQELIYEAQMSLESLELLSWGEAADAHLRGPLLLAPGAADRLLRVRLRADLEQHQLLLEGEPSGPGAGARAGAGAGPCAPALA